MPVITGYGEGQTGLPGGWAGFQSKSGQGQESQSGLKESHRGHNQPVLRWACMQHDSRH
jgi:hypothetical protein